MNLKHSLGRALSLFSRRDKRVLLLVALAQIFIAFLDLIGVVLLGAVAAITAAAATNSEVAFGSFSFFANFNPTDPEIVILLAFSASIALVGKSILSLLLTRKAFRFLANRQALISSGLAARLLTRPLLEVQNRSSQEIASALTGGVTALTIGTIGPALVIVAELALVTTLFLGLLFIDPLVAGFTVVFFGLLTALLQIALGHWARNLGERQARAEMQSITSVQHTIQVYREICVTGRRSMFIERFASLRWESAKVQADSYVLNQVGKYVFEIGLIIGAAFLATFMAATRDIPAAVAIITVFLAASSRIFPSLLRMQASMTMIKNSQGASVYTFDLISDLQASKEHWQKLMPDAFSPNVNDAAHSGFPGFIPVVEVSHVSLRYPGASRVSLDDVSLSISPGESIAFVGNTGAGKSTLADAILGVIIPDFGEVKISGKTPAEVVAQWPGAMAYVPQNVTVLAGSVRENVALGIPINEIDDSLVWSALDRAQLSEYLIESRDGLETIVGENGVQLSGGQRQRLGIARALYSRPRLLVLDEATSSLDAETERAVTETLDNLTGDVTIILIAHRLATVKHCSQVIYLAEGKFVAGGTFDEVRAAVPEFNSQANLLGISQ